MPRVLHVLAQRPLLTGSGVTLDAMIRHAVRAGWEQCVIVGVPSGIPLPAIGALPADSVRPLFFGLGELAFDVPGMSDVMPYPSTRYAAMNTSQLNIYRQAWRNHLQAVIADFRPDLIHTHHIWIVSAMLKDVAPDIPVVNHCHATGLRQMVLCPHLVREVKAGCRRNDKFVVLHRGHAADLSRALDIPHHRTHVVGAGYREEIFHSVEGRNRNSKAILYIGKYSAAKGLPWLLDAVERLQARIPGVVLHVAGSGAGVEAKELRRRMVDMSPGVMLHGQLGQLELADLMRRCSVCVLPSFYEGVPLVLVEALACGCHLVATALPGVLDQLAPYLGSALDLVPMPRLIGVDSPDPADLAAFVDDLERTIESALARPPLDSTGTAAKHLLVPFTWGAVFERIETIWRALVQDQP